MDWGLVGTYLLAVGPLLALALAAARRRGPAETAVLVFLAPVILVFAGAHAAGRSLGVVLACLLLLVAPVLPWYERWARFAVPAVALLVDLALTLTRDWSPVGKFWIDAMAVVAVGALVIGGAGWLLSHLDGRTAQL